MLYHCCSLLFLAVFIALRYFVSNATCEDFFSFVQFGLLPADAIGHAQDINDINSGCASSDTAETIDIADITITPMELEQELKHVLDEKNGDVGLEVVDIIGGIGDTKVPRILHQSHISTTVPVAVLPHIKSWHDYVRDKGYRLVWWTDEDNYWLVHTHYPQYAHAWDALYHPIEKADCVRYFYLHRYGGLYADADMKYVPRTCSTQDWDLEEYFHSTPEIDIYMFKNCHTNSIMASAAGHKFWKHVWDQWSKVEAGSILMQNIADTSGIRMLRIPCTEFGPDFPSFSSPPLIPCFQHAKTNSWRWMVKRDDTVRILDELIMVVFAVLCIGSGITYYRQRANIRRSLMKG